MKLSEATNVVLSIVSPTKSAAASLKDLLSNISHPSVSNSFFTFVFPLCVYFTGALEICVTHDFMLFTLAVNSNSLSVFVFLD